jgi:hypothetical protein
MLLRLFQVANNFELRTEHENLIVDFTCYYIQFKFPYNAGTRALSVFSNTSDSTLAKNTVFLCLLYVSSANKRTVKFEKIPKFR